MATFVIDASIAAAWFLEDEQDKRADDALFHLGSGQGFVPSLFWHEVRHLMIKAARRGRTTLERAQSHIRSIRELELQDCGSGVDDQVIGLAESHGLSAYDACYLALSIEKKCPLLTLDNRLLAAAELEQRNIGTAAD